MTLCEVKGVLSTHWISFYVTLLAFLVYQHVLDTHSLAYMPNLFTILTFI